MSKRTCSVTDCETPSRSLGMCDTHYRRYKKFGTTDKPKRPRKSYDKTCALCGTGFVAKSSSAKYCGSKCRVLARPGLPPLYCADCSKRMQNSKTSAPQGKARCSDCINGGRGYYEFGERRASHGRSAYAAGCRCDVCRDAQAAGMREYVAKRVAVDGVSPSAMYRRVARGVDPFAPVPERSLVPCFKCGDTVFSVLPAGKAVHKKCKDSNSFYVSDDTRTSIYSRDGWECQICFESVQTGADYLSDWYPTLDHIVPQSRADEPDHSFENLRTAHRYCNLVRGAAPLSEDFSIRRKALLKVREEVV